jgi:hypothetical protein
MPNLTTAIVPRFIVTPNIPNTGTGVQIIGQNGARNGLVIANISANIMWLSPSGVTGVSGTVQSGQVILAAANTLCFGGVNAGAQVGGVIIQLPFIWTDAMFALAAAGATNVITVYEF